MKKLLTNLALTSAVLTCSIMAFANGGTFVPAHHHGGRFYVGAGVARETFDYDTNVNFNNSLNPALRSGVSFDWGTNTRDDYVGSMFAGYDMVFADRYTLALEGFGNVSTAVGDARSSIGIPTPLGGLNILSEAHIRMLYSLGLSLLPGVQLTDNVRVYGRIGWVNSRFRFNASVVPFLKGAALPPPFAAYTGFLSNNENGIQLGFGGQVMVSKKVALRGEYDWQRYGSFSFLNGAVSLKPTVDTAKADAIYYFNS